MSYVDLHMHSHISLDGEYTPGELIALCHKNGLRTVALTDHNSVRGVEEMIMAGRTYDIRVITGIELDCVLKETDLHLLGYGIDITDRRYRDNEQAILQDKRAAGVKQMQILRHMGILFQEEKVWELSREGIVVAEMIAEAAIADDRNRHNPLVLPYLPGGNRSDNPYVNFFWDFCSQGKAAYAPAEYMSFEQAQQLITETGGISVIAHPVNTVGRKEEAIAYMLQQGVQGIEVFSSYHKAEDIAYYKELSSKYQVMMSMGSDFHGKSKPSVYLGKTGGDGREKLLTFAG